MKTTATTANAFFWHWWPPTELGFQLVMTEESCRGYWFILVVWPQGLPHNIDNIILSSNLPDKMVGLVTMDADAGREFWLEAGCQESTVQWPVTNQILIPIIMWYQFTARSDGTGNGATRYGWLRVEDAVSWQTGVRHGFSNWGSEMPVQQHQGNQ